MLDACSPAHVNVTVFPRVDNPIGRAITIAAIDAHDLAVRLQDFLQDTKCDCQLWQGAVFKNHHRSSDNFIETGLITVDADYGIDLVQDHVAAPTEVESLVTSAMRQGRLRATLGHLTPRGIRLVLLLREPILTVVERRKAGIGAMELVREDLQKLSLLSNLDGGKPGYSLDGCSKKAAQAMWLPNFDSLGMRRQSEVILVPGAKRAPQLFDSRELAELDRSRPDTLQASPIRAIRDPKAPDHATSIERAVQEFNERHAIDFAALGRTCPSCRHRGCFNEVPGSSGQKWFCHSSNHETDSSRGANGMPCGHIHSDGFVGDALDLAAHARGIGIVQLLQLDGYLAVNRGRRRTVTFRLGE